jgi:colanic acid biosynthesis glycosyl transferase WcaI
VNQTGRVDSALRRLRERPFGGGPVTPPETTASEIPDPDARSQAGLRSDTPGPQLRPPSRPSPLRAHNVLLVGINYAPEPTGIAPYTTGMARHLAAAGARVTVLTGVPHYPQWQRAEGYGRALRTRSADGEVEIVRLSHLIPKRQSAVTRAAYEATFLTNVLACRPRRRPDLVLAVTPSLSGAVAGPKLARRYGVPLVTVVQDLVARAASETGIKGGRHVAGMTATLEGRALRAADRVVIVSEAFRSRICDYGVADHQIVRVPNWTHVAPSPVEKAQARRQLGWPVDGFLAVHSGNMGLKQDLGNVLEAARLLADEPRLQVMLVGDGSQRRALEEQARGIASVQFVDLLDEHRYPLALAAADLLLLNERPTVGDMCLPSKLTSYLVSGRPLVAAVARGGATAQELARADGAAAVVDAGDPWALAEAIRTLRGSPSTGAQMGTAGLRYAKTHLSREAALDRLEAVCSELVGAA